VGRAPEHLARVVDRYRDDRYGDAELTRLHGAETETSEFTRSLGFDVLTGQLDAHRFPDGSFDAVFVMNCFEQLPDPAGMLRAGHFHPVASRGVGGPWMQVAARAA
jgi:hypothetical protein